VSKRNVGHIHDESARRVVRLQDGVELCEKLCTEFSLFRIRLFAARGGGLLQRRLRRRVFVQERLAGLLERRAAPLFSASCFALGGVSGPPVCAFEFEAARASAFCGFGRLPRLFGLAAALHFNRWRPWRALASRCSAANFFPRRHLLVPLSSAFFLHRDDARFLRRFCTESRAASYHSLSCRVFLAIEIFGGLKLLSGLGERRAGVFFQRRPLRAMRAALRALEEFDGSFCGQCRRWAFSILVFDEE